MITHNKRFAILVALVLVGLCACSKEEPAPVASAPEPAKKEEPAPVASAPEPAKCADGDMDGVCDSDDQCPETKAGGRASPLPSLGRRIGPSGCDCDYTLQTHFASDSAELVDEDKAELDRLAEVLKNPNLHFIAGSVDGYTDDAGDDAYNKTLSKQRADAVAEYLTSKGVQMGDRLVTQGLGEENPIADNTTEEGRAQNRRATIRRTDCSPAM